MKNSFLFLFLLAIIFLPESVFGKSVIIQTTPEKIYPGDAFLIKIKNLRSKNSPVAIVNKKEFVFVENDKNSYIAIGAMDINSKPKKYKIRIKSGNKIFWSYLHVKKKKFPSIHINLPEEKVFPNEIDQLRIADEKCKMEQIWQLTTEKKWEGSFILPIKNEISTKFGAKRIMNQKLTSIHWGIDFKAQEGEGIKASNNGKVVLTENLFYGGNTIVIDHGLGIYSIYMHLSDIKVKPNDEIKKGEVIGNVGSTGRATGPHLHFGIKINGINVSPVSLIKLNI